jgi:LytS/YehU family sensor histidine kinase
VKHGVSQVASTGFIAIDILKNSQNDLQVSVHDNGLPFPEPLQKGFGITSTTDKLRLLYGANNFSIVAQNSPKKQIIITLSTFNKPTIQHKKN